MATKKYLDDNGLTYYHSKVKALLAGKQNAESGKGLSTNDYTTAEKTKLAGIAAGAEVNVQSDWNTTDTSADAYIKNKPSLASVATSGSYNDLSNKPTIPTIPTNVSAFTNDAGYQNAAAVQNAINDALADVTGIDFQIVQSLPSTGTKGIIYLVPNSGSSPNIYDEYIWITSSSSFEKIGTTDIDLSGYVLSSELVAISNAEIDTVVA